MTAIVARAYLSPSLVLLAMDWADGGERKDFLGFAVRRTPGFADLKTGRLGQEDWLPNRIGFHGPAPAGQPDPPTNTAPIQKFMWWDAHLEGVTPDTPLTYEIFPVCGDASDPKVLQADGARVEVQLPRHVEHNIGTWFNRAVMSSQAFSRMADALGIDLHTKPTDEQALKLRSWLANGMEKPVPDFIAGAGNAVVGAIYHLTDALWIIPALAKAQREKDVELVYDGKTKGDGEGNGNPNAGAIEALESVTFDKRDKTNIMHNKFLVGGNNLTRGSGEPVALTCGSANYTTEGLTSQANLIHTFASPELASLYLERFQLLRTNPTKGVTAHGAEWSKTVSVGDAGVRVFFSPEPGKAGKDHSASIETIVQAIHGAASSVLFCLFDPTDKELRDACFAAGDAGKMMFGLVNKVAQQEPTAEPDDSGHIRADRLAALEIYHRSRDARDVIGGEYFGGNNLPEGFQREVNIFPGDKPPPFPPVIIHHKFVIIDAETDSPVIYTGSANMSGNSVFGNDENLLEMKGSPRLAHIYLAEFLRLYEHYRARASFISSKKGGGNTFSLSADSGWAKKHYKRGTPEYKARLRMLGED